MQNGPLKKTQRTTRRPQCLREQKKTGGVTTRTGRGRLIVGEDEKKGYPLQQEEKLDEKIEGHVILE